MPHWALRNCPLLSGRKYWTAKILQLAFCGVYSAKVCPQIDTWEKKLAAPEIPPEKKTFHWFWALLASIDGVACDIALEKYVMKHEINITYSVQLRTIISAWSAWIFVSLKTVLTEIKYQTAGPSMNLVHVDPNLIGFKSNSSFKSLPIPSP